MSPATAAHVLADLRVRIELIVDGGATPMGWVCGWDHPAQPGALSRAAIARIVNLREARSRMPSLDVRVARARPSVGGAAMT
jgi:hypothetical protein